MYNILLKTGKYLFYFALFFCFSSSKDSRDQIQPIKKYTVIIDAGHGGKDTGAIGYRKLREKEITLNIALIAKATIESIDKNIEVILTRNNDKYVALGKRTKIAKGFNADLFISVHCDAIHKSSVKGATIYMQKKMYGRNYTYDMYRETIKIGLIMEDIFKEKLNLKSRGLKSANYQVLRETLEYMPSILVETGYITNSEEATYFLEKGQKGIGIGIGYAITRYFKEKQ